MRSQSAGSLPSILNRDLASEARDLAPEAGQGSRPSPHVFIPGHGLGVVPTPPNVIETPAQPSMRTLLRLANATQNPPVSQGTAHGFGTLTNLPSRIWKS